MNKVLFQHFLLPKKIGPSGKPRVIRKRINNSYMSSIVARLKKVRKGGFVVVRKNKVHSAYNVGETRDVH